MWLSKLPHRISALTASLNGSVGPQLMTSAGLHRPRGGDSRRLASSSSGNGKSTASASKVGGFAIPFEHVETKLREQLSTTFLQLRDVSSCGCGQKFEAVIVSPEFEGKTLLAQQRLVMSVLKDEMKVIHSFAQKTYTPTQWQKMQQQTEPV